MKLKSFEENKPELGISIYPNKASKNKIIEYCKLAKKYGFKRIFTNLIGLNEKDINKFSKICNRLKVYDFDIIVDVDETVLDRLKIKINAIDKWKKLGVKGIRMDVKFNPKDVANLSHNSEDFQLEINASDFSGLEDELTKFKHNYKNIIGSHNFFPQENTGLSLKKFEQASKNMKFHKFKVSAFASMIENENTISAWDESANSSTLEIGRKMDVTSEIRLLMASKYIDYIIVSNMFLSKEQFIEINKLTLNHINFKFEIEKNVKEEEIEILNYNKHKIRGDNPSEIMFRSTISRKIFSKKILKPNNTTGLIKPCSVVICNEKLGRYKSELHIMKSEILNNGNKNIVGYIDKYQLPLMEINLANLTFSLKTERKKNEKNY